MRKLNLKWGRISGLRPAGIASMGRRFTSGTPDAEVHKRISDAINKSPVVVFMKGVPEAPRCGFSNAVCKILQSEEVDFESYDVLSDEDLRSGIKTFTNWPTIPQVFIKGEFIGGADILMSMYREGSLSKKLKEEGIKH
eukprot:TRINITY_DN5871_c0_g1_i1.p1 TRINITY_DN5871_c0_g1~~TRINITY_DN5871_c0_g1_i1.p1  ORF type:complete len:139 (-),score=11.28 TRINITY_DN5871_c0_g1_i1:38-454(-)